MPPGAGPPGVGGCVQPVLLAFKPVAGLIGKLVALSSPKVADSLGLHRFKQMLFALRI